MEPNHERAIVLRPDVGIEKSAAGENRIVAEMLNETLVVARTESQRLQPRFKIGAYEWCEPDYLQIQAWAKALALDPEVVIERLASERGSSFLDWAGTRFEGGRMMALQWNLDHLPLENFDWVNGLALHALSFCEKSSTTGKLRKLSLPLPKLRHLQCEAIGLVELDLRYTPRLETIDCSWNKITVLDLSRVPMLTSLTCQATSITNLDLSRVPKLDFLFCGSREIQTLDLGGVPNLRLLNCNGTSVAELDLSPVANLLQLDCRYSSVSALDLTKVPRLRQLFCSYTSISHLDLPLVPMLVDLTCDNTGLTELDIRELKHLEMLEYLPERTRLIQRADQNF